MEQMTGYIKVLDTYVPFKVFEWEKFIITLHLCTYWDASGEPRWPDLFALLGRGNGKDGVIALESMLVTSPYNGIPEYDVDVCANNEDQAMRPVQDLIAIMEQPKHTGKLKKFWKWLKESVRSIKTNSTVRGRTNSPKGKDGLRSGMVIFNEIHQYENYENIDVFTTGLGKKRHPRRAYFTTNGKIREGPLDDYLEDSKEILDNPEVLEDNGWLPFICRLNRKEEVDDEKNWTMANPSLPYMPHLLTEIRKEYREWKKNPDRLQSFIQKRMNLTEGSKEAAVAEWKYIKATEKELPDLTGWSCSAGVDLTKTTDWAAVDLHFKDGDQRFDINHAWICGESADLHRIKAPWQAWVAAGDITFVDEPEINPKIIAEYIKEMGSRYQIEVVCIDNYRYAIMSDALKEIGFSKENKNLVLVAQRDIIQVEPIIERCFINYFFSWGDVPHLRWAANNTKIIRYGRDQGADKGSFVYAKIEAKSRKTDPFMALVAAMVGESRIRIRPQIYQNFGIISI